MVYVAPARVNTIDYVTIATLGNALDFGDLTQARFYPGACSSNIRGVFGGGDTPSASDVIDYVTNRSNRKCSRFWRFN